MSKGKEHKMYEFGAKASVVVGKNSGVILGSLQFTEERLRRARIRANA